MLDIAPRILTVEDVNTLCNFAELAVRELERQQVVGPSLMLAALHHLLCTCNAACIGMFLYMGLACF